MFVKPISSILAFSPTGLSNKKAVSSISSQSRLQPVTNFKCTLQLCECILCFNNSNSPGEGIVSKRFGSSKCTARNARVGLSPISLRLALKLLRFNLAFHVATLVVLHKSFSQHNVAITRGLSKDHGAVETYSWYVVCTRTRTISTRVRGIIFFGFVPHDSPNEFHLLWLKCYTHRLRPALSRRLSCRSYPLTMRNTPSIARLLRGSQLYSGNLLGTCLHPHTMPNVRPSSHVKGTSGPRLPNEESLPQS